VRRDNLGTLELSLKPNLSAVLKNFTNKIPDSFCLIKSRFLNIMPVSESSVMFRILLPLCSSNYIEIRYPRN
jgi:hypothetical protein